MLLSVCFCAIGLIAVLVFILYCTSYFSVKKCLSLKNKHVLITGGSLGIGKCVALEAARRGAHVTILARNVENLEKAVFEIKAVALEPTCQQIQYISVDLSNNFEALDDAIIKLEETVQPVYMLVNCAGTSICAKLEDLENNDIKYLLNLNILGTIFPCKALLPRMKARREGCIVITASQAALIGIFGYTVYSATKFALRGFAEALQMEVKPYGIRVTLSLPPDTDTPGFAVEMKTKPHETKLISESAGIVSPELVANQLLDDALNGNFFSTVGFESVMAVNACAGMSPCTSFKELLIQVCTMGVLRVVGVLYLHKFNYIVRKCVKDRCDNKKTE